MKSQTLLCASLMSLALLQACGGGSDASGWPMVPPPAADGAGTGKDAASSAIADSGEVSTPFVRSAAARYMLLGVGSQSFGRLTASEQAAGGAMTKLNDNTLSGTSATQDIRGDADFAIGRWVAGTVTRSSGAETLTGKDNRAYHYIAFNELSALPTTGTPTCDAGVFTTPTYGGGAAAPANTSGTASGSASLAFTADGAVVNGSLAVSVGALTAAMSLEGFTIPTPTSTSSKGALFGGGSGALIQVGASGNAAYLLVIGYAATLPSGARFQGVAKFRCA